MIFISKSFRTIVFVFIVSIEMIQPGKSFKKMISQVESFLCSDKQGTSEEGRRIQRLKRCEENYKDEDNSLKTLTDKNNQC